MKRVLGRKQNSRQEDWVTVLTNIRDYFTRKDLDAATKEALPMLKSKNARRLSQMVSDAGFDVTVIPLKAVDRAEKRAMPLAYRLMNPHKRMAVVGVKSLSDE